MKDFISVLACFLVLTVTGAFTSAAATSSAEQNQTLPPTDEPATPPAAASASGSPPAQPPRTEAPTVSSGCVSVGTVAEQIATWRDAHGSEYLAQIEVQRRLSDPAARNAALSIVTQLYTGFAKDLSPRQAREAYTDACGAGNAVQGSPTTP